MATADHGDGRSRDQVMVEAAEVRYGSVRDVSGIQ